MDSCDNHFKDNIIEYPNRHRHINIFHMYQLITLVIQHNEWHAYMLILFNLKSQLIIIKIHNATSLKCLVYIDLAKKHTMLMLNFQSDLKCEIRKRESS